MSDSEPTVHVGEGDAELDARLSEGLDAFNEAASAGFTGVGPQRELTVRVISSDGVLQGGTSGWTWGEAAGIAMTWVDDAARGSGVGARMLDAFEREARARGCRRVFTTSFTFQAPGFYERLGYREIGRWEGLPTAGEADVHLMKEL